MNLLSRSVLRDQEASFCAFCGVEVKTISHLFVTCGVALRVWDKILDGLVGSRSFLVICWVFSRSVVYFLGERVLGVIFC